jgi:leucyl-tRNA synthetase
VVDGKGWRSGATVERRKLSQWFLKITKYADELLEAIKTLDGWPEKVRLMQENWIGKSEGAYIDFMFTVKEELSTVNRQLSTEHT